VVRKRTPSPKGAIPARYSPGMLATVDRRTTLARLFKSKYDELITALGGDDISPQKRAIARMAAEVESIRALVFERYAKTGQLDIAQYSMLCDKSIGCHRLLGMERIAKRARSLHELISAKPGEREARS
jgi:hypothetical protein